MATLVIDPSWTPTELEREMSYVDIPAAKHSTLKYYLEKQDTSFPINLEIHGKRGRALVIMMTNNRPGWQWEVWEQYQMFMAINVESVFVYDPTASTIYTELLSFTRADRTKAADMVFITFCGHGCSKEGNIHDIHLITDDVDFNIWAGLQLVLGKNLCQIKEKPKLFIVQACRDPDQRAGDENTNNETQQDMKCIRKLKSLQEYIFVFASQPGEVAFRRRLMNLLHDIIRQYAYCKNMQEMVAIQLLPRFQEIYHNQIPQILVSMSKELNIFPGITETISNRYWRGWRVSVQESGSNDRIVNRSNLCIPNDAAFDGFGGMKSNPKGGDGVERHSRSHIVRPSPDSQAADHNTESVTSQSMSFKGQDSWTGAGGDSKYDVKKLERPHNDKNKKTQIEVNFQRTYPEDSEVEKEDAQRHMYEKLDKSENRNDLAENLSDELETAVDITNVTEGSIIIHITLEDEEALNTLVFMSDTGLLSYRMQMYLVTPKYLNCCKAERVKIKATVNSQSMPPFEEEMPLQCVFEKEDLSITCPFQAVNQGIWFKDDHHLTLTERHDISYDGQPQLKIVRTTKEDRGRYKCEYTALDKRIHRMECSVFVLSKIYPPTDIDKIFSEESSACIGWSEPDNNPPCLYRLDYWLQSDPEKVFSVLTKTMQLSCIVNDLKSDESYRVTVTAVPLNGEIPEYTESDPQPENGLLFKTRLGQPTDVDVHQYVINNRTIVEIKWLPVAGENIEYIVRYGEHWRHQEQKRHWRHIQNQIQTKDTVLRLDDLQPGKEYSFSVTSVRGGEESEKSPEVTITLDYPR